MARSKQLLPMQKAKKRYSWDSQAIRALRDHLGMTQRQMAEELEVRQQTISEWETGFHIPHRSTQKTLSMVAERAGFHYHVQSETENSNLELEQSVNN
jgi:putative transcriptional regulator